MKVVERSSFAFLLIKINAYFSLRRTTIQRSSLDWNWSPVYFSNAEEEAVFGSRFEFRKTAPEIGFNTKKKKNVFFSTLKLIESVLLLYQTPSFYAQIRDIPLLFKNTRVGI